VLLVVLLLELLGLQGLVQLGEGVHDDSEEEVEEEEGANDDEEDKEEGCEPGSLTVH